MNTYKTELIFRTSRGEEYSMWFETDALSAEDANKELHMFIADREMTFGVTCDGVHDFYDEMED